MSLEKSYRESIKEYTRGVIGGLLFSFPLLYTMEVWWAGYTISFFNLLILVVLNYIILLGYNRYAGMHPGVNWKNIFIESVEEIGIGLVVAFIVLFLLNRISLDSDFSVVIGKVVIETMMVSIGVSVGTAQMGSSTNGKEEKKEEDEKKMEDEEESHDAKGEEKYYDIGKESLEESKGNGKPDRRGGKLAIIILSFCGSILVSSSVAPTDEVWILAVQTEAYHVLIICILSIALSMITGYYSNFRGTDKSEMKPNAKDIIFVTCLCYISSLIVAGFLLWFFGRFENVNFSTVISSIVILGAIASLGGSAGRLLIK